MPNNLRGLSYINISVKNTSSNKKIIGDLKKSLLRKAVEKIKNTALLKIKTSDSNIKK